MDGAGDSMGDMFGGQFDPDVVERMLMSSLAADSLSRELESAGRIVAALRAPATAAELAGEAAAIEAAMRAARLDTELRALSTPRRKFMHPRSSRLRITTAFAGIMIVATAGIAMAGDLPAPAQDAVSHAMDHVGITLPASDEHPVSTGEDISTVATTTDATGAAKGAEVSGLASGGRSQAGQYGDAAIGAGAPNSVGADGVEVPADSDSGSGVAGSETGGTSDAGTSIADDSSGGHSAAGSESASVAPLPSVIPPVGTAP